MNEYLLSIRADEGRPDLWPSAVAGSADAVAPVVTDEELADWAAPFCVTDGRTVSAMFRRAESERWARATVRPIIGRGNDAGSTGRAWTSDDDPHTVDLERAADAWLAAADYPIDRPDRIAETVDMTTFLPLYEVSSKADRVAWRGAAHYTPITHNRGNIREYPASRGDRTRSLTWKRATGRRNREAVDVTRVDPITITWCDHFGASLPWAITWQDVTPAKRKASIPRTEVQLAAARAKRAARRTAELEAQTIAETNRLAHVKTTAPDVRMVKTDETTQMSCASSVSSQASSDGRMTSESVHVVNDRQTAVYGRLVTAWSASPRSLPRILARGDQVVRDNCVAWTEILATTTVASIHLVNGSVLEVTGALVDDGLHGPMTARVWAQRAAIAGVLPD